MSPARVDLDYVAPRERPAWLGVLVLAASLAIAGAQFVRYRDVQLELARLDETSGLVNVERRPARPIPKERLEEELKSTEVVIRQLALPWGTLVDAIERAATPDVALLQLQPDAQQRMLRIAAEARHREAMFAYLRRLSAAKALADVHVVNHHVQPDDPQRPIQFSVQATLRGAQ